VLYACVQYALDYYPPFASGCGFILSRDLVQALLKQPLPDYRLLVGLACVPTGCVSDSQSLHHRWCGVGGRGVLVGRVVCVGLNMAGACCCCRTLPLAFTCVAKTSVCCLTGRWCLCMTSA
jgi:hypothetical protein